MFNETIKTELELKGKAFCGEMEPYKKWVSLDWLKIQVQKKYDESYNLPGDVKDIRDLGRMDSLRWVLSLLEG